MKLRFINLGQDPEVSLEGLRGVNVPEGKKCKVWCSPLYTVRSWEATWCATEVAQRTRLWWFMPLNASESKSLENHPTLC